MTRLDSIATLVDDMPRSLGFYRLLGFDIPPAADADGYVSIGLRGGMHLSWNTENVERTFHPGSASPAGSGRMGITLRCSGAGEVDRLFREVVAAGYAVGLEPYDAAWGARCCRLLDPDGNAVDLVAPLP
ncbi:MAG: VOC family protein [Chloroflexi bacterium]|nr:VOC family protein [Chloroflexota bacterium]